MKDRKTLLLEVCLEFLKKQDNSQYILNLLEETVFYDGADCDGHCLMADIEAELALEEIKR